VPNDGHGAGVVPDAGAPSYSFAVTTQGVIPDSAGNTVAAARDVTLTQSTSSFSDFVGSSDANDYYKFTLPSPATLQAYLSGMTENADLQLLDSTSTLIASSNQLGPTPEIMQQPLAAGTYYAQITPVGGTQTYYNLTMNLA
jgi:hypothetical protein